MSLVPEAAIPEISSEIFSFDEYRGRTDYKGEKHWVYGYHLIDKRRGLHIIQTADGNYRVDSDSVGQNTHLKDDDGTPIYVGDIMKCVSYDTFFQIPETNESHPLRRIMEVVFHNGSFCMEERFRGDLTTVTYWPLTDDNMHNSLSSDMHIIGNVHDNPDMLEKFLKQDPWEKAQNFNL